MRLKDFTTAPYPNHSRSIDIEENTGTKIYTVFLRITGTLNLSYKPKQQWLYLIDRPVNEYGSDITVEALGMNDGYLVMVDCFGIYPIIVTEGENYQAVIETAENSKPELWTERGMHSIDDLNIYVGSSQMTDFDNKQSMTLIRSAEFFKDDEVMP